MSDHEFRFFTTDVQGLKQQKEPIVLDPHTKYTVLSGKEGHKIANPPIEIRVHRGDAGLLPLLKATRTQAVMIGSTSYFVVKQRESNHSDPKNPYIPVILQQRANPIPKK